MSDDTPRTDQKIGCLHDGSKTADECFDGWIAFSRDLERKLNDALHRTFQRSERIQELSRELADAMSALDSISNTLTLYGARTDGPFYQDVLRVLIKLKRMDSCSASLIDAIQSIQDWNGTQVGDAIDAFNNPQE